MIFRDTSIQGVRVIELEPFSDHRGMFTRVFCKREMEAAGLEGEIVQINHSCTRKKGVVRGLHFQRPPRCEAKIIRCIQGAVFDVAVDLRQGSDTFLKWFGAILSRENNLAMHVPEGCAHGFQTLEPDSELLYLHTEYYAPESEGGFRFDDPALGVQWPMAPVGVSERDAGLPNVTEDFKGLAV